MDKHILVINEKSSAMFFRGALFVLTNVMRKKPEKYTSNTSAGQRACD